MYYIVAGVSLLPSRPNVFIFGQSIQFFLPLLHSQPYSNPALLPTARLSAIT